MISSCNVIPFLNIYFIFVEMYILGIDNRIDCQLCNIHSFDILLVLTG